MIQVYLTRRNLMTLLNKLDHVGRGGESARTLIKNDTKHPKYPQSHPNIVITAVEDDDYYTEREPGLVVNFPNAS